MVSILMGVYHPSHEVSALRAAVESICAQSYTDWELLLCDDGSSAAAMALLDTLAAGDARIVLLRGSGAHALAEKLNVCLAAAGGELLARMDADDISHADRLEKQVAFLKQHPEIAFVGCCARLFYGKETLGERHFPALPTPLDFRFNMPFLHPALLFRAEVLRSVGGYSTAKSAVLCEDYELLLRLYERGYAGANLPAVLFSYCISPDDAKKRRYRHRINEAVTRWQRFGALGLLPQLLPWVLKPLVVGLLPAGVLQRLKENRKRGGDTV